MATYASNHRFTAYQWNGWTEDSAQTLSDLKTDLPNHLIIQDGDNLIILERPDDDYKFIDGIVVRPTEYVQITEGDFVLVPAEIFKKNYEEVSA